MSEVIKSFVRIRPQLGTDAPDTPCLKVISDKDGERITSTALPGDMEHPVDKVLTDSSDEAAVFELAGQPAVDTMLKGEHACISVMGQGGSGKTHTVFDEEKCEGLIAGICKALAGNEEANMSIIHIHNEQLQDLITGADGLKIKYDDAAGVQVEGSTTIRIPTSTVAFDHIKKCKAARKEFMKKAGEAEELCYLVYMFGAGEGKLNVVECCASQRIWKASLTPEEKKLLGDKNKIYQKYVQMWLDTAIHADPKAVGWKDAKAGRFIQAALSQAIEGGKGFGACMHCVWNAKTFAHETVVSVATAERSVKQETLKTVSEYKEIIALIEERLDINKKQEAGLKAEATQQEQAALKIKADNEAYLDELNQKEDMMKIRIKQAEAQGVKDLENLKKEHEKKKEVLEKKNKDDLDRLRNLANNAPAQAEIDTKKKIAEVEEEHEKKMTSLTEELATLKKEIEENKEIIEELTELKETSANDEKEAMKPVKALEKELAALESELKTAGTSREAGLSESELENMQETWDLRDELDDLEEEIQKVALECMAMEYGFQNEIGKPSESSSEDSSESDSDSDSDSNSDSDSDDSTDSEEERENAKQVKAQLKEVKEQEKQKKTDRAAYDKELEHFRDTVNKDTFLADLLDKIVMYLDYGTNVSVLHDDGTYTRHFLYLGNKRTMMCFGPETNDPASAARTNPQMAYPVAGVARIIMGQHSKKFQRELKKVAGRVDPPRSEVPPTPDEICAGNLHRYYYRSITLELNTDKNGTQQSIDIICDTQTDFEAMIVAFHRQSSKEAYWGKKLYIDFCEDVEKLEPFEKAFCENIHLTPQHYLYCKAGALETDERLYITLHDLRVISGLDLFHSQRLLEVWTKQRWIVRRQVNYFKYQEKLLASAEKAKNRHADPQQGGAAKSAADMEDVL